jgi:hypothetical protein
VVRRTLAGAGVAIATSVLASIAWLATVQLIAVPMDICIDLDGGGRFAYFVLWLLLSAATTAAITAVTVPMAILGWRHLALGLVVGLALVTVAAFLFLVSEGAAYFERGCEAPAAWPEWLVQLAGSGWTAGPVTPLWPLLGAIVGGPAIAIALSMRRRRAGSPSA